MRHEKGGKWHEGGPNLLENTFFSYILYHILQNYNLGQHIVNLEMFWDNSVLSGHEVHMVSQFSTEVKFRANYREL